MESVLGECPLYYSYLPKAHIQRVDGTWKKSPATSYVRSTSLKPQEIKLMTSATSSFGVEFHLILLATTVIKARSRGIVSCTKKKWRKNLQYKGPIINISKCRPLARGTLPVIP